MKKKKKVEQRNNGAIVVNRKERTCIVKLISVESTRTLLHQTKQENIYLMKASKLILSYPLRPFARPHATEDFVNLY